MNGTLTLKAVPIISYHDIENFNITDGSSINETSVDTNLKRSSTNLDSQKLSLGDYDLCTYAIQTDIILT